MAKGRIKSVRTVSRSRPPGASSMAMPSAMTVVSTTVQNVKTAVTQTELRKSGSSVSAQR